MRNIRSLRINRADITRRGVLQSAGAAAGLAVLAGAQTPRAAAAEPGSSGIVSNVVADFAGTEETNSAAEVAGKLSAIYDTATKRLADMDAAGSGELFAGLELGTDDVNLERTFRDLYEIALATRTALPAGSSTPRDLLGNLDVQHRVIDGLKWVYDNYFGDQQAGYYGNWYNWEIAIPKYVSRTLALLQDQVRQYLPSLLAPFVHAMDLYLRHGKNGDVDLDSRFHTGANLADITTNRIIQGALLGDEPRIAKAISDQMTVFQTIDPYNLSHGVTDGYYADGSFIQHGSVAYTGSYGKVLLSRVVQTIKFLDGTPYAQGGGLVPQVHGWIAHGFAPLIFEGWMMELVKGRAVSRPTTGYQNVAAVIEGVVDLSGYGTAAQSQSLKSYAKYLNDVSRAKPDPSSFESPMSIVAYTQIIADDSIPMRDLSPEASSVAFNAMDKSVHRRPGYSFALSRSSDRISKYEYMSGDNLMPWFQGDGAYYLYLSGNDQTQDYGVDYYTDVEPYRLAGVTSPVEHRRTVPECYGLPYYNNPDDPLNFTSSSESQNKYVYFPRGTNAISGGATLGPYGLAGMVQSDDVAYRDKVAGILPDDFVAYANAESTKSWFMLDDEIVVLAAGIQDDHGRDVLSTIDSRIADPDGSATLIGALRDGRSFSGTGSAQDLAWLQYHDATQNSSVGYVFLDSQAVDVRRQRVENSRRIVRSNNHDTLVAKNVFDVSVTHPAGARPASIAYAILPNAGVDQLDSYLGKGHGHGNGRGHGAISVIENSTAVQAVRHRALDLTAVNVFDGKSHTIGDMTVDGTASVLVQRDRGGRVTLAVSDPSFARDSVSIELRGRPLHLDKPVDGVRMGRFHGKNRLDFDTHHLYGATLQVTLRPH